MECVADVECFVKTFAAVSGHVIIKTGEDRGGKVDVERIQVELFASKLFQAVARQLGGTTSTSALDGNVLGVPRTIVSSASSTIGKPPPAVADLEDAASTARAKIKSFTSDATKETNLSRLRGIAGDGYMALNSREQALQWFLLDNLKVRGGRRDDLDRDRGRGQDRRGGGDRHDRDRGRDRDRAGGPSLLALLARQAQTKKNMPGHEARALAARLANGRCIGCLGRMNQGKCVDRCTKTSVHKDVVDALAKRRHQGSPCACSRRGCSGCPCTWPRQGCGGCPRVDDSPCTCPRQGCSGGPADG